ncbi:MAG: ABC transporter permease [Bacilli bacterium]
MIVFNTFWKVIKKYKATVILYTAMLVIFGSTNMQANNKAMTFTNTKPNILIVNNDKDGVLTKNLVDYLNKNTNIVKIKDSEEARDDALFYRDVSYIIYIPTSYSKNVLNGINNTLDIKSTNDYNASLAEMILKKYIEVENVYASIYRDEAKIINAINKNLETNSNVEITSKLNTTTMEKTARFYNFASYCIMAVTIYIVCLVLSSFHNEMINKRIVVSSMNYKKHNRLILGASFAYALIVWILYIVLGIILLGDVMFTIRGLIYVLNTLIFTFVALTLALLISTITNNKNAISGIVNVVALAQAFLCGAFIPTQWLPNSVLTIAHVLPAYWYINTNDILKELETISSTTLKPVIINSIILILFSLIFIILNNIISKKKRQF